jgi:hypothetical protein
MNAEIKSKWVAALRSGEYKQTKDTLRDLNGFCCLGVLCDLHSKESGNQWERQGSAYLRYLGEENHVPSEVGSWAGITNVWGTKVVIGDANSELSGHNDDGRTFYEIADAIEEQL